MMDKISPEVFNALLKIIIYLFGFLGTIVVGIISYFLGSYFKQQKDQYKEQQNTNKELITSIHGLDKSIVGLSKDVINLHKLVHGRQKNRPRTAVTSPTDSNTTNIESTRREPR